MLMTVVAIAFEAVAVATAMPAAGADLGQMSLYAWTFTAFVIGMALATVLAGRVADRHGPILPTMAGLALFGAGLVLAALAWTMPVLLVARFVQGLGGGGFNVALMVVVARTFEPARRAWMMTAFSVCWVLPAFLAPPVAAWLTEKLSWHWVFGALVPVVVIAAALVIGPLRMLAEQLRPDSGGNAAPVPVWAAVVASVGVALVQVAGQRTEWRSLLWLALGLVALAVSLRLLMAPGFFQFRPGIAAVSWTRALQAGSFFAAEAFLPLSLTTVREVSLFEAGLMLTIGSVGWTTGSFLQARARWRRDQLIVAGTVCSLAGIALIAASTHLGWSIVAIGGGWTVAGLGMGLATASGSLAVMTLSEPAQLGRNTGSLNLSEALGNALFIGLAGAIYANLRHQVVPADTFGWVFVAAAAVALASVASALRVGPVVEPARA